LLRAAASHGGVAWIALRGSEDLLAAIERSQEIFEDNLVRIRKESE
jgi:hypothetical protein